PGVNAIGSKSHLNSIAIRLVAGEDSSTITTIDPPSTIHTAIFHFMGDLLTLIRVCDVFVNVPAGSKRQLRSEFEHPAGQNLRGTLPVRPVLGIGTQHRARVERVIDVEHALHARLPEPDDLREPDVELVEPG